MHCRETGFLGVESGNPEAASQAFRGMFSVTFEETPLVHVSVM